MQGCERGLVRGVCDGGHARVSCRGAVLAVGWAAAGEGSGGGSATAATTAAVATATGVAAVCGEGAHAAHGHPPAGHRRAV